MSRAVGRDMAVSTKVAIEICNWIRSLKLVDAKRLLSEVIDQKRAVPFHRFTNGIGHRKGKGSSGRYPIKACTLILKLINNAEKSAEFKSLDTKLSRIIHIVPNKAAQQWHYGRLRRRKMKRTHIEIVLESQKLKEKKKKVEPKKVEPKKVEPKKIQEKPVVAKKLDDVPKVKEIKKDIKQEEIKKEKVKKDIKETKKESAINKEDKKVQK